MIKKLTMTECELCGKSFMRHSPTQKFCCRECYKEFKSRQRPPVKRRFSGRSYKNPEQRLNEIREKYKNGITADILRICGKSANSARLYERKLKIGGDEMTLHEQDIVNNIPISELLQNINVRVFSMHKV